MPPEPVHHTTKGKDLTTMTTQKQQPDEYTTGLRLILKGLSNSHAAVAAAINGQPEPPKSMTGLNITWNHAAITLFHEISVRNQKQAPDDDGELTGAANLMHAWTMRTITVWATKHPDEAQALEDALTLRIKECGDEEAKFNGRSRADNVRAIRHAMEKAQNLPPIPKAPSLPWAIRPTVEVMRLETLNAIYQAESEQPDPDNYIYFHDSHFDAFITNQYCEVLLGASDPF